MTDAAGSEIQSTAGQAKQKVQEKVGETAQQVQGKAQEVKGQAGGRLRQEVDTRSTEAGSQLQSTAQAMRRTSEQLRGEGKETPAKVAEAVAQRTERLGSYLTSSDADRILRDVENTARKQPWLVAVGGAVLGFLAARFLKASSSRRYESGDGASPSTWRAGSPALSADKPGSRELPAYSASPTPMEPDEPAVGAGSPGTAAAGATGSASAPKSRSRRGGSRGSSDR